MFGAGGGKVSYFTGWILAEYNLSLCVWHSSAMQCRLVASLVFWPGVVMEVMGQWEYV
jgi:hypothetical protein